MLFRAESRGGVQLAYKSKWRQLCTALWLVVVVQWEGEKEKMPSWVERSDAVRCCGMSRATASYIVSSRNYRSRYICICSNTYVARCGQPNECWHRHPKVHSNVLSSLDCLPVCSSFSSFRGSAGASICLTMYILSYDNEAFYCC